MIGSITNIRTSASLKPSTVIAANRFTAATASREATSAKHRCRKRAGRRMNRRNSRLQLRQHAHRNAQASHGRQRNSRSVTPRGRSRTKKPISDTLRQALDAFFAKPFSPLFPGAAKGNLCAAYPSFDCEEKEPQRRPLVAGNEGSQQAGLFLKNKAHISLSYRIDANGHSTEERSGSYPAIRNLATAALTRLD
jgi:hypothetical protein